ncbi:MAG: hypothetical protein AAFX99_29475, partial [Myxococcota bacterium]
MCNELAFQCGHVDPIGPEYINRSRLGDLDGYHEPVLQDIPFVNGAECLEILEECGMGGFGHDPAQWVYDTLMGRTRTVPNSTSITLDLNGALQDGGQQSYPLYGWPSDVAARIKYDLHEPFPHAQPTPYQASLYNDFDVKIIDINGDSKSDIVLLKSRRQDTHRYIPRVWLNTGDGFALSDYKPIELNEDAASLADNVVEPEMSDAALQIICDDIRDRIAQYTADHALHFLPPHVRQGIANLLHYCGEDAEAIVNASSDNMTAFGLSLYDSFVEHAADLYEQQVRDSHAIYESRQNFHTFFFDVNSDGLPDLVAANPYNNLVGGCADGYQVMLNQGSSWSDLWGIDPDGMAWSATGSSNWDRHPFLLLANRDGTCNRLGSIDNWQALWAGQGGDLSERPLPMSTASFVDINYDGRTDVVFAYAIIGGQGPHYTRVFLNTGVGFATPDQDFAANMRWALPTHGASNSEPFALAWLPPSPVGAGPSISPDRARFVDVDNDGLLDVVYPGRCAMDIQQGVESIQCSGPELRRPRWRRNLGVIPDMLTQVTTQSGTSTTIAYAAVNSTEATSGGEEAIVASAEPMPSSMRVTTRISSHVMAPFVDSERAGAGQVTTFTYRDFMRSERGSNTFGFVEQSAKHINVLPDGTEQSIRTVRHFQTDRHVAGLGVEYPNRSVVWEELWVDTALGTEVHRTDYTTQPVALTGGARVQTRTTRTESSQCLLAGQSEPECVSSVWEATGFDAFGYPTQTRTLDPQDPDRR